MRHVGVSILIIAEVCLPFSIAVPRAEAATAWNSTDWPYQTLLTVDHTKVGSAGAVSTTTYSTAGTYYFTVPAHTSIVVEVWGAGGGGGGATANNGAAGGQSSFNGTVLANGGSGGTANNGAGGAGGTASGGDTNTSGTAGISGGGGGAGGAGANGGVGGSAVVSNHAGNSGTAPGGGGSGGYFYYVDSCGKGLCYSTNIGGGGGGGGYSKKTYSSGTLTPGSSITVVVGSGGAGGTAGTYAGGSGAVGRVSIGVASPYSNVEDFPVYVNLAHMPSEFWDNVRSDCGDIRVLSSHGAPEVPREIVSCDTGTDTGEMWFRAPLLSGSTDMPFYIAYGNPAATDYAATETYGRNNVWSNGYAAVWHLSNGTTLSGTDATGNANTGTAAAGATATTGNLNGGAAFAGSGTSYIEAAHSSSLNLSMPVTLSAWVYLDSYGGAGNQYIRGIISKYKDGSDNEYFLRVGNTGTVGGANYLGFGGSTYIAETTNLPLSQWVYVTGSVDSSGNATLLKDGAVVQTGSISISASTDPVRIGDDFWSGASDRNWDGNMDEVRVANVARSLGWVKTEYNNQNSPATFYSVAGFTSPPRVIRLLGNVRLRGVRLY